MKCDRCKSLGACKYSLALINVDQDSFEEGSHVADVDIRLCSECEQTVADMLQDLKDSMGARNVKAAN